MAENEKHENEMSPEELQNKLDEIRERIRKNDELLNNLRRARAALEAVLERALARRAEKETAGRNAEPDGSGRNGEDTGKMPEQAAGPDEDNDPRYKDAVNLVLSKGIASTSLLQWHLHIGYGHSVRLLERMTAEGIVASESESRTETVTRYYVRGGGERQDGQRGNDTTPGK